MSKKQKAKSKKQKAKSKKQKAKSKKQHVTDAIRNDLTKRFYSKEQPLPSELELARAYGVSRHTVRSALDQLKRDGKLYTRHGVGSFPRDDRADPGYIQSFTSIDDLLLHTEDTNVDIVARRELVISA